MTKTGLTIAESKIEYKYTCDECKFKSDDRTQYNKHLICKSHCDVCDCGFIDI